MRMRKKRHAAERTAACREFLIEDREAVKADPHSPFENKGELRLEIGCGKGAFAVGTALKNPDINLYAMEMVTDVLVLALEKAKAAEPKITNLRFISGRAETLEEYFPEHSLSAIYLNFSDPWPKKGYAKRRLTHRNKLEVYRRLLVPNGRIIMKTDNVGLFDFSLEELRECGFEIIYETRDLHASDRAENNVMTEYEKNFSEKGVKINCLEAVCRRA